jgi:hypothetical protein
VAMIEQNDFAMEMEKRREREGENFRQAHQKPSRAFSIIHDIFILFERISIPCPAFASSYKVCRV